MPAKNSRKTISYTARYPTKSQYETRTSANAELPPNYIEQGVEACRECEDPDEKLRELLSRTQVYTPTQVNELLGLLRKTNLTEREQSRQRYLLRKPSKKGILLEADIIEALRS